jgi:hypothetical protein
MSAINQILADFEFGHPENNLGPDNHKRTNR